MKIELDRRADSGDTTVGPSNPLPVKSTVGGTEVSATAPLPAEPPKVATYRAVGSVTVGAQGCILQVQGSATKTVKIKRVAVSATKAAGAVLMSASMYRTTAANSGGTATLLTAGKMDTTNAAATAVVHQNTGATLNGTSNWLAYQDIIAGSATILPTPMVREFVPRNGQEIVLRGVAEFFEVFAGTAGAVGSVVTVEVEWTEE